jgi:hypothetical protein
MRKLKKSIWPHKVTIKDKSRFGEHKVVEQAEIWLGKTMGIYKGRWNYIYRYNETDQLNYRSGGRRDRQCNEFKPYCYIPVNLLKKF